MARKVRQGFGSRPAPGIFVEVPGQVDPAGAEVWEEKGYTAEHLLNEPS
jgi:hypothetical protein